MFLVILYHSCLFWGNSNWFVGVPIYDTPIIHITSAWLNSFHIHCFTFISGYIFCYLKYEKGSYQIFKEFVGNKFRRLIIPYIFIATVWVVPLSLYFYDWTLMDIIKKYVLCTSPSQLWFLWMLFDVFIIGWWLSDRLKNDKTALLIAIISFIIGVIGNKVSPNIFCIWIAARFFPLFILGMKLREKKKWFIRKIPITAYVIFDVVLFMVWKWLSAEAGSIYKVASVVTGFGLNIIGALMAFFVLQEIARRINWTNSGIISYLSK